MTDLTSDLTPRLGAAHLLIFVDDTGHESFAGNQKYYGLGGIAVLFRDYQQVIKPEWRRVRTVAAGAPDVQLHAANFGASANDESFAAMEKFFRWGFARFAVTATVNTTHPSELVAMQVVSERLKQMIEDLALPIEHSSVVLLIESSQRANPLIERYFGALSINRGGGVPVEHCFMEKRFGEPGLEIADFVVNAAGGLTRRRLEGRNSIPKDFQQVFGLVPDEIAKWVEITDLNGNKCSEYTVGKGPWPNGEKKTPQQ